MAELPLEEKPDVCVGIPEAGYPIADRYPLISGILSVRVLGKSTSGTGRQIVPMPFATKVGEGKTALVVDDLITKADSKFEAIHALEELGFRVTGVAVLFDREQGGAGQLQDAGYRLYAPLRLTNTLDYYLKTSQITQERYNQVMDYLSKPRQA